MAVETGTATNYLDLLDKLRLFASTNSTLVAAGEDWSVERWTGGNELILKGPGLAAADEIYVGIQTFYSTPSDYFNWTLMGATGYVSGNLFTAQPGISTLKYTYLWNSSIPYWFVGSGRRLIVVAKISTVYQMAYLGLILPYTLPGQWPYPLAVGGTGTVSTLRWSSVADSHTAFWAGYITSPLDLRLGSGTWVHPVDNGSVRLSPDYNQAGPSTLITCPGGDYPILPKVIASSSPINTYGELDGVFHTSGYSAASEDTVTVGTDDYLIVQDVFRTGIKNFCAVKLV